MFIRVEDVAGIGREPADANSHRRRRRMMADMRALVRLPREGRTSVSSRAGNEPRQRQYQGNRDIIPGHEAKSWIMLE